MADNPKGYANPQLLTSAERLASRMEDDQPPLVIDLRPAEAFAVGHIPGAVHLDLFGISLTDTDPAPLRAFCWILEHLLASRGVGASLHVVVYDDQSGIRAARAFWALEYFGHEHTRLLDGGFSAWQAGGHRVSTAPSPPRPTTWTGTRVDERIATWHDVHAHLEQPEAVLVDTRSQAEYDGTKVRAARGGCIPGAVHLEWTDNLGPDGAFKPGGQLRAMYEAIGVTPDKTILTYCQGGYRAAHSYLALRLLGYPHVRPYVGSWKEWGDRLDLPVQLPTP